MMASWRWKLPCGLADGRLRRGQLVEALAALGVEAEVDGQLALVVWPGDALTSGSRR